MAFKKKAYDWTKNPRLQEVKRATESVQKWKDKDKDEKKE